MLQGSIVELYRSCGQPRCRCQRGQKHGPAYYLSRKADGRTRMLYVPKGRIDEARQKVSNYKRHKRVLSSILRLNEEIFRQAPLIKISTG